MRLKDFKMDEVKNKDENKDFFPSGIVLPGDKPLTLKEVIPGLFVVENAYQKDLGYFAHSSIYK